MSHQALSSQAVSSNTSADQETDVNAPYGYVDFERQWQRWQPFLAEKGYMLRSRYHPGWVGSWVGTDKDPKTCEDSLVPFKAIVMDATRISDGRQVMLKLNYHDSDGDEVEMLQFLNSEPLRSDPHNHTVPLLELLPAPVDSDEFPLTFIVMPALRMAHDPQMITVGELLSYVKNVLEGLAFMHQHNVAHRDVAYNNILMDASNMYPDGFQAARSLQPDHGLKSEKNLRHFTRSQAPVKYFYIDFEFSVRYASFAERSLMTGDTERGQCCKRIPEYSTGQPYDPFKADVFACGWLLYLYCFGRRGPVNVLTPLVDSMLQIDPDERPTAADCAERFAVITRDLSPWYLRAKLGYGVRRGLGLKKLSADYWEYAVNLCRSIVFGYEKLL